jgi:hypothetical protein
VLGRRAGRELEQAGTRVRAYLEIERRNRAVEQQRKNGFEF